MMARTARLTADALAEQFFARGLAGRGLTAKQTAFIRSLWQQENPGQPMSHVGGAGTAPDGRSFTWIVGRPTGGNRRTNLSSVFRVIIECDRCCKTHDTALGCDTWTAR